MRNLVITSPELMKGEDIRLLQHAYNLHADDYGLPKIDEDERFGLETLRHVREMGYYRGAPDLQLHGPVRPHLQLIIRAARRRYPQELKRGHDRYVARRLQLRQQQGPDAALAWWRTQLGVTEHPFGSNRGGPIRRRRDGVYDGGVSAYQRNFDTDGAPWCGAANGTALLVAGVRVDASILWTPNLRELGTVVPWDERQGGDLISLLGHRHQGMLDHDRHHSFEGNTSPGDEGSQDNGGCVAHKLRDPSLVDYVVRPHWRKP